MASFVAWLLASLIFSIFLFHETECDVYLRPISSVQWGANVTLFCELSNEQEENAFWSLSDFNETHTTHFRLGWNIPTRYRIRVVSQNTVYCIISLTITDVREEDTGIFTCTAGSNKSRQNMTIMRRLMQAPKSEFNLSVSKLCYNGNYNSVLYVLLSLSNLILILIVFSFLKVLRPRRYFDIQVAFGCLVAAIAFYGIIIIFFINPSYVATNESVEYWLPIVVAPQIILVIFINWIGIFYFLFRSYLENKLINMFNLGVSSFVAISHFVLCLIILNSIIYCTGKSSLPNAILNYSVISDLCGTLILFLCLFLTLYFFGMFKEHMQAIGIITTVEKVDDEKTSTKNISLLNPSSYFLKEIKEIESKTQNPNISVESNFKLDDLLTRIPPIKDSAKQMDEDTLKSKKFRNKKRKSESSFQQNRNDDLLDI